VIIRPRDAGSLEIVGTETVRFGFAARRIMKIVGTPDPIERPEPATHVGMIARGQNASTLGLKSVHGGALGRRKAVPGVDTEEPDFVESFAIESDQQRVVA